MDNNFVNNWMKIDGTFNSYMKSLEMKVSEKLKSNVSNESCKLIFTPHAGIRYSGLCSMSAYYNSYDPNIKNIIILSTDHRSLNHIKRYTGSLNFKINKTNITLKNDTTSKLNDTLIKPDTNLDEEHSILMQLPFIYYFYKDKIPILPLIIGNFSYKKKFEIIDELFKRITKNTLIVCNTDISHINGRFNLKVNQPIYYNIRSIDSATLKLIDNNNSSLYALKETSMCGASAVYLFINIRKRYELKFNTILYSRVVCYYQSNQLKQNVDSIIQPIHIQNNSESTVSYVGIIYSTLPYINNKLKRHLNNIITEFEKITLVEYSKLCILNHLEQKIDQTIYLPIYCKVFQEKLGVFITLSINDKLRGCIGTTDIKHKIIDNIKKYAIHSATQDSRFPPVTISELGIYQSHIFKYNISSKVSLLNESKKLTYDEYKTDKFKLGFDGIVLELSPNKRGFFLPSVAKEDKTINKEKMLEMLCRKISEPNNCYKNANIKYFFNEGIDF